VPHATFKGYWKPPRQAFLPFLFIQCQNKTLQFSLCSYNSAVRRRKNMDFSKDIATGNQREMAVISKGTSTSNTTRETDFRLMQCASYLAHCPSLNA
jgi:hypothetical protein